MPLVRPLFRYCFRSLFLGRREVVRSCSLVVSLCLDVCVCVCVLVRCRVLSYFFMGYYVSSFSMMEFVATSLGI